MDRRLLDRARQGDPAGYGALVREHQDIAFRMAYLVVGDAAETESTSLLIDRNTSSSAWW